MPSDFHIWKIRHATAFSSYEYHTDVQMWDAEDRDVTNTTRHKARISKIC